MDLGATGDDVSLMSAETVDELHVLLLSGMTRRRTTQEPEEAFRRHHPAAPDAVTTARLMLTDRRWDRLAELLVAALVDTGLLPDDRLDGGCSGDRGTPSTRTAPCTSSLLNRAGRTRSTPHVRFRCGSDAGPENGRTVGRCCLRRRSIFAPRSAEQETLS